MAHRQGGNLVLVVGEVHCSYHLIDKMQKKYEHKIYAKKHEYKYRSNEYRWNIGEDDISIPLKNAGAMTKSRRERVDFLRNESET